MLTGAGETAVRGSLPVAAPADHVRAVVARSGTSFFWGMRLLPRPQREAMFAIYAFCREVDDVADEEDGEPEAKLERLAAWRDEVDRLYAGRPTRPTTRALAEPVAAFGLPREEFIALVDGMEMDARELMRAPALAELWAYCRRVAGAVGLLSIRVFGASELQARDFALALGDALQLTNILRDLREDAARDRLYVPRELLDRYGVGAGREPPSRALADPAFPSCCAALAELAGGRFERADALLAACDRRRLRPAVLMMEVYRRTLARLNARGWRRLDEPVRIAKPERLWIALRHGLW